MNSNRLQYSRSQLLKLQHVAAAGSHFDWSSIDNILNPQPMSNIRGIKARVSNKLGEYSDKILGKPAHNLVTIPSYCSVIADNDVVQADTNYNNIVSTCSRQSTLINIDTGQKQNKSYPKPLEYICLPSIYATNC